MAADDKNPFMDMFSNFGKSMNLPTPDVEGMIDYHRKNLQALQAATQVGTSTAQSHYLSGTCQRCTTACARAAGSASRTRRTAGWAGSATRSVRCECAKRCGTRSGSCREIRW